MDMTLTFARLQAINQARNKTAFGQCADWSINDWMTAIAGEVGEAANIAKKIRRGDPPPNAEYELAQELADVVLYCDLLMTKLGGNLGEEITQKFNEVSQRVESGYRL